MVNKRVAAGVVAAVIALAAASPLFLYGLSANAVEVDASLQLSSGGGVGSSLNFYTASVDVNAYTVGEPSVQITQKTVNGYEYLAAKLGGLISVSEDGAVGSEVVDITIVFNLTTPSGQNLTFTFNPQQLQGMGLKHIKVLLGPDELNRETGVFYLSITITVQVTPPGFDTPVVDLTLTPVNLNFTVPT